MSSDLIVSCDGAIERGVNVENARNAAEAGDNALLLGEDGGGSALIGIDAGVAGGIARGAVLGERVLQNGRDAS